MTGQLLCNVLPSIIKSFLMLILITGHNAEESQKITELRPIYEWRVRLKRIESLREVNPSS
jgi:low-affinity ferrous iron transport protein